MYEFILKSGRSLGTDKLESLKGTIWVVMIDWARTDKRQFKAGELPAWIMPPL
jgi:hypothetical protein